MSDSYTETTTQSWGSRIGGSLKGIVFGLILFLISFPVLWWNEGRTVERHLALQEGAGLVVAVDSESIDPANEGKLIHTSGTAISKETLTDAEFAVSIEALQLVRQVAMYQWQERTESRSEKNLGGSETTTTTYHYEKGWSTNRIDSSQFRHREGHENPNAMAYESRTMTSNNTFLGRFRLTTDQVDAIAQPQPMALTKSRFSNIRQPHQVMGDTIYVGSEPSAPRIGDLKISFSQAPQAPASIVGKQQGSGIVPYRTKAGGNLLLVQSGVASAEEMFQSAEQSNIVIAWLIRVGGFALMYIGLSLVLRPLSVLADVVPFIGSMVGFGTGSIAFLIALPLSLLTIALAWIFYRPLLAIGLMVAAIGVFVGFWRLKRGKAGTTASPLPGTLVDRG